MDRATRHAAGPPPRLPPLDARGLREGQVKAIEGLKRFFREERPRALVQMATAAGRSYAALTPVYPLLKSAWAKRILLLVDRKNLGEQVEQEFISYLPANDNTRR